MRGGDYLTAESKGSGKEKVKGTCGQESGAARVMHNISKKYTND